MDLSSAEIGAWVGGFMWPFMRIGAMMMANPVFGSRSVPVRVRVMLTLVLTMVVAPHLPDLPAADAFSSQGMLISLHEILIGLTIGFSLQLIFASFVMAGDYVANAMGLGFASMVDPVNGVNVPIVSQVLLIVTFLLFFSFGGHMLLIEVLITSFSAVPVGIPDIQPERALLVAAWASRMFGMAVLTSIPVVASLLLIYVALGVMTRAAPQLNIFSVGFPLTIFAGFIALILALPSVGDRFSSALLQGMDLSRDLLGG